METMQTFYTQLFSAETRTSAYLAELIKLTQLKREQIAALKTMLWWNGWGVNE